MENNENDYNSLSEKAKDFVDHICKLYDLKFEDIESIVAAIPNGRYPSIGITWLTRVKKNGKTMFAAAHDLSTVVYLLISKFPQNIKYGGWEDLGKLTDNVIHVKRILNDGYSPDNIRRIYIKGKTRTLP